MILFYNSRMLLLFALLFAFLLLVRPSPANAEGWPSADCQILLKAPQPTPDWGTKEKPDQTTMLIMLNYQMAVSLCQQNELIKTMQEQNSKIGKSLAPSPSVIPSKSTPATASTTTLSETLKDALLVQSNNAQSNLSDSSDHTSLNALVTHTLGNALQIEQKTQKTDAVKIIGSTKKTEPDSPANPLSVQGK